MNLYDRIPNNVNLSEDKKLQRALEKWLPNYLDWWREMGPEGFRKRCVAAHGGRRRLRSWAHFDFVKMPDYRWGIFLEPRNPTQKSVSATTTAARVPGSARRISELIASHHRDAGRHRTRVSRTTTTARQDVSISLRLRNLFPVNVEEGRHLWAMVYLLHGTSVATVVTKPTSCSKRSGNPDKPRILEAFNQPCDDWLNFFAFTMFTDRDGKYQLSALAESVRATRAHVPIHAD